MSDLEKVALACYDSIDTAVATIHSTLKAGEIELALRVIDGLADFARVAVAAAYGAIDEIEGRP